MALEIGFIEKEVMMDFRLTLEILEKETKSLNIKFNIISLVIKRRFWSILLFSDGRVEPIIIMSNFNIFLK